MADYTVPEDGVTVVLPADLVADLARFAYRFYVAEPMEADALLRQVAAHAHHQQAANQIGGDDAS